MSPSLSELESQWLAQLRNMREAIADLKLDQLHSDAQPYGHDIVVDDDQSVGGSDSDSVWDVWTDEEEEESSNLTDGSVEDRAPIRPVGQHFSRQWLKEKCWSIATGTSGLDPGQLEEQVAALLASELQDYELQVSLSDMVGCSQITINHENIQRNYLSTTNKSRTGGGVTEARPRAQVPKLRPCDEP